MQPILKPLSVVLAECCHFVVTWSVQEYFYTVLCYYAVTWSVQEYVWARNPLIYVHAHAWAIWLGI